MIRLNGGFFILSDHILVISQCQEYDSIAEPRQEYRLIADNETYTVGHSTNGQDSSNVARIINHERFI